ncbi:60S ribosomal protein L37a [Trifolium repens]|nr:60S ribosomal protein L37a [Trifolium repens]
MEVSQQSKFFCEFCGKYAVKRKAVGIWGCKDCGKVKAWGAYTLKFLLIGEEGSVLYVDKFQFLDCLFIAVGIFFGGKATSRE